MRTTIIRLAAMCGLVLGTLVLGTAAAADNTNPNGPQHINQQQCNPVGPNTACMTIDAVFRTVSTPSGNRNIVGKGMQCFTITDTATGAPVSSTCSTFNGHSLVKDGTTQEDGYRFMETLQMGGTTVCTITVHFHEANGVYQFYRFEESGDNCP